MNTSMGLLRLNWRKSNIKSVMKDKLMCGVHTGQFGMIKVSKNPANGYASVIGWIISPATGKQIRLERWFYRNEDANLYVRYVKEGDKVLDKDALSAGRLFRQVRSIIAGYDVKRSEHGWVVYESGTLIGSIEKISDTDLCETWFAYDAIGTKIGQAMSKRHALSSLAIHYINLI